MPQRGRLIRPNLTQGVHYIFDKIVLCAELAKLKWLVNTWVIGLETDIVFPLCSTEFVALIGYSR